MAAAASTMQAPLAECGGHPPVQRHAEPTQIPGMRLSTSAIQGHGVDEPEALQEALRRSRMDGAPQGQDMDAVVAHRRRGAALPLPPRRVEGRTEGASNARAGEQVDIDGLEGALRNARLGDASGERPLRARPGSSSARVVRQALLALVSFK